MPNSPLDLLVARAVRRAQRNGIRLALTGYLILFGGLIGERIVSKNDTERARKTIVSTGTVALIDACNGRFDERTALRDILIALRLQAVKRMKTDIGIEQRQRDERAVQFYDDRLQKLTLPDCRSQLHIISADPNKTVDIPTPKHP